MYGFRAWLDSQIFWFWFRTSRDTCGILERTRATIVALVTCIDSNTTTALEKVGSGLPRQLIPI